MTKQSYLDVFNNIIFKSEILHNIKNGYIYILDDIHNHVFSGGYRNWQTGGGGDFCKNLYTPQLAVQLAQPASYML